MLNTVKLFVCLGRESNPHCHCWQQDFKSCVSTSFTTKADVWFFFRARDEARTRDLNLGKVALYQLSYSRIFRLQDVKRARDEARTRDLNLGKVALYQLSYSRLTFAMQRYDDFLQLSKFF
jgi:hypothetical protein